MSKPITKLLDPHALRAMGISYHPNHLRSMWMTGKFPKPINLSPRRIAWRVEDIQKWIEQKAKAR
jgi:predicted DNA-binding transcriptional regulator AlpA